MPQGACSDTPGHRRAVRRILEGFWEAKFLDFGTFFDVFSKSFLKSVAEGQMIDKKTEKSKLFHFFGPARRNVRSPGER